MKNFKLIEARKKAGLSQEELAKLAGLKGKQTISNWENGVSSPNTISKAFTVARILNTDVALIFGNEVQDSQTNKKQTC